MTVAAVNLWGRRIGAVSVDAPGGLPAFEYDAAFARSGIELSPLTMPLAARVYEFPALARLDAFAGLPGLLADSLPDRWGRTLVDGWLQSQGRAATDFDVVERLCYVGKRGMGALEFEPAHSPFAPPSENLQLDALVELAELALADKQRFVATLTEDPSRAEVAAMLALGTSAGGARPKALIAFNESTGEVRSGQIDSGDGFKQLLIKFDGIGGAGDHGVTDPQGWGEIEYAYSLMAQAAGIEMMPTRLLEEGNRRHFMTERFDRNGSAKLHMQTVAALEHADFNDPGSYSYEQVLRLAARLGGDARASEEILRRAAFNVLARNHDDHVKNTAFTMDREGRWSLAPAYDLTWSYKPGNRWLEAHQMSLAGRRDGFTRGDLQELARFAGIKPARERAIFDQVASAVGSWSEFADQVGIDPDRRKEIAGSHLVHNFVNASR